MGSMHSHGTQRRMMPKSSNSFKIALQTQLCWDHHPIVCYTPHPTPPPPPKTKTSNIKCKCTHTPTASFKVGFINKWEPGDGEVYSTCSIPKGEHCQALWHALHSSAPRPQSWCPFAPTCCPNKLPFPFGFVPPHTSTTTISYQEMPHTIVSRESTSDMLPQSPSKSSSLRTEDDLNGHSWDQCNWDFLGEHQKIWATN
jgi:hypothetical protein